MFFFFLRLGLPLGLYFIILFYRWHLAAIVRRDRLECSIGESDAQEEKASALPADGSAVTVLSFRC